MLTVESPLNTREPAVIAPPLPGEGDALIVVDVQNDFLPGGPLAVTAGDRVIAVLNRYITLFQQRGLPLVFTRDWHPADHCSFHAQGGPWPPHCVAGTPGAAFPTGLQIPASATLVSKGASAGIDAYSGFQGTGLGAYLQRLGCRRVFVGGLATDYCVLATVRDARHQGLAVVLLGDAIRAVNVAPDDGPRAETEMRRLGARPITWDEVAP